MEKVSKDGSLVGSSVIVGSSWGKSVRHFSSWGQKVITPKIYIWFHIFNNKNTNCPKLSHPYGE